MTVSPPLVWAALRARCPRCGEGRLYDGMVRMRPSCPSCHLSFAGFNVGDGPAAFLTLFIGTIIVFLAFIVEMTLAPSLWVHFLLWTPLIVLATIVSLRLAKAAFLVLEYHYRAVEAGSGDPPA